MPRRVQDIVSKDRRSIKEVPLEAEKNPTPRRATKSSRATEPEEKEEHIAIHKRKESTVRHMPVTPPSPARSPRPKNRLKWLFVALGIIVVIGIIGFIASSYYSRASFTIVPKVIPIAVNGTYVAQPTPASGALAYDIVTIKGTASTTIPATNGPQISTKAQGKAILYNTYSSQPVRLIAGTRLTNSTGQIYRITSSLVIPGYTKPSSTIIPGTVSVMIAADQPGQTYDIASGDETANLKIMAYVGSPKENTIYAKASDITGGFVGTKKVTNPTTVASSTASLKTSITASLLQQVKNAIPEGYVMYDNSYTTAFGAVSVSGGDASSATVSIPATMYGILFKKSDLIAKLSANQSETAFGDFGYTSPGLDSLQISIANIKDLTPDKKPSLVIHAKGDMKLIGTIPVDEIKSKLEGISLAATQTVFKSYSPVIESGSGELVPPWAKIPTNPDRISITVSNP